MGVGELLTEAEHEAVSMAGRLYAHIVENVIGDGLTRDADIGELAHHIHHIQHAVMAQAAARRYPDRYRPLGGVIVESDPDGR